MVVAELTGYSVTSRFQDWTVGDVVVANVSGPAPAWRCANMAGTRLVGPLLPPMSDPAACGL